MGFFDGKLKSATGGSTGSVLGGAGAGGYALGPYGAILGGLAGSNSGQDMLGNYFGGNNTNDRLEREKLKRQVEEMMNKRPEYQDLLHEGGGLDKLYKVKTADYQSNLKGLDQRFGDIQDVQYGGDINAGQNFMDAQGGMDYLSNQAYSEGPSAWANSQLDYQSLQDANARDQIERNSDNQLSSAYSNLAMQGGLDSGARERLAMSGSENKMSALQDQARSNQMANLGVISQDEANKMNLAQQLPSMNMQMDSYNTGLQQANRSNLDQINFNNQNLAMDKASAWAQMADAESARKYQAQNQANIINKQNLINDQMNRNSHNLGAWQDQMASFGAGETADAQAKAGEKKAGNFQWF